MSAQICAQRAQQAISGRRSAPVRSRTSVVVNAATRKLWAPNVEAPSYLDGTLAGDRGFDPLGLGSKPAALKWYQQAELMHARWAMVGAAGVLAAEVVRPDVFFYTAGLPQNLPEPFTNVNMGGILAFQFLMMHFVEIRRWQDIKNHGCVNTDPIFSGNSVTNLELGYPGFDPLSLAKGDLDRLKSGEIKNGRLAMIAFMGFIVQAQATGKGPIAALGAHISNPTGNNFGTNIGTCVVPGTVDVQGLTLTLTCLWPGQH